MRRRDFIAALGSGAIWPLSARAQQPGRLRRVSYLSAAAENDPEGKSNVDALGQGLHKLGWIENRNLRFEVRRATGGVITKDLAENLVTSQPDVLIAPSTVALRLLHQATSTIPTVFIAVSDPASAGVVASLARPGGNITGFSSTDPRMVDKWYEILKGIAPQITKVLTLFNPNTAPYALYEERLKAVAPSFALEPVPAPVQTPAEIESTLARAGESGGYHGGWGMISMPDSFLWVHRRQISDLAAHHRVPAIYPLRPHAVSGGLISYGADFRDLHERAASYVHRILQGEKPSELPVQSPVKFETVVNLKAAQALGVTIPDAVMAQADEVIE